MNRLDRILAAGARQRELEAARVRTGTDASSLDAGMRQLRLEGPEPNWDKFFNGNPSLIMDYDELAAYEAMASRAADVLNWYEQARNDNYYEELVFLDRAFRFNHYSERAMDGDMTMAAVRDAVGFLQQTMGSQRVPFYRLVRGVPRFHEGPTGETYNLALLRLKEYFESIVLAQSTEANNAIRNNRGQYRARMQQLNDYWDARLQGNNSENVNPNDLAESMDYLRNMNGVPPPGR